MTREMSNQAAAAKMIRRELKAAFPTVAFRVTSESFSMGDAVNVRWTDGPTSARVEAIVGKYQYGHFDGMIDLYEYSNRRNDIPQSKFVQTHRDISPAAERAILDHWGGDRDRLWRAFTDADLLCGPCGAAILPYDNYCPMCGGAQRAA